MVFEKHIFISYAHVDNEPEGAKQKQWISDFHRDLAICVNRVWGKRPAIWRDDTLHGNDYFKQVIEQQFPKVALLLSVLSPRYIESKWCIRELKAFCRAAEQTGGILVGKNRDKSRIFKVIKTEVDKDEHPDEIRDFLGYPFYGVTSKGERIEFNNIYGSEAEEKYHKALLQLAYDIRDLLKELLADAKQEKSAASPDNRSISIYLAETTSDVAEAREKVKSELQQRGYTILPRQPLVHTQDCARMIRENLERCQLSIHLVGAFRSIIPEKETRSMIELQYSLAQEHRKKNSTFTHLTWLPVGLQPEDSFQETFIDSLRNEPDFLQMGLEEFKTLIQQRLKPSPTFASSPAFSNDGVRRVYLICDAEDRKAVRSLRRELFHHKFEIMQPLFEGDEGMIRQHHQDCLCTCDAVVIYCGDVKEYWFQAKLSDLRKIPGYGRSHPLPAKAVLVGEPYTEEKEDWCLTHEAEVLRTFDDLQTFLAQIPQGGAH